MVEDSNMGKLRTIAQVTIGLMRGHNFGWKTFWALNTEWSCLKLMFDYVAVKFSHLTWRRVGCAPSLCVYILALALQSRKKYLLATPVS